MTAENTKNWEGGSLRSSLDSNDELHFDDQNVYRRQPVHKITNKPPTDRRSLTEPVGVAAISVLRRNVSAPSMSDDRALTVGLPSVEAVQSNPGRVVELLAKYQSKVRDSKRMLSRLRLQKDAQLNIIKTQLFYLESQLRKEQKEILSKLDQRDATIASQQHEITKLRKDNRRLMNRLKKLSEGQETSSGGGQYFTTSACSSSEFSDASIYGTLLPRSSGVSTSMIDLPSRLSPSVSSVPREIGCTVGSNNISLRAKEQKYMTSPKKFNHNSKPAWEGQLRNSKSVEAVNPNVASVRAMTDRVLHKPPIAEKPKVCSAGCIPTNASRAPTQNRPPQLPLTTASQVVRGPRQCTIVSTISRLLEEESDGAGGGSSSEPSSPEATLKPQTPRVIRLARQYEGIVASKRPNTDTSSSAANSASPEFIRSQERVIKSLLMDEYEVTSGYNSDAISDHDYENIRLASDSVSTSSSSHNLRSESREDGRDEGDEEGYVEEEDNYVVLQPTMLDNTNTSVWEVTESEDLPIYSNVNFDTSELASGGRLQMPIPSRGVTRSKSLDDILETNLDSPVLRPVSVPSTPSKLQEVVQSCSSQGVTDNQSRSRLTFGQMIPDRRPPDHMADNFEEFTLDSLVLDEDQESARATHFRNEANNRKGKENLLPTYELRRCGDGAEMQSDSPPAQVTSATAELCASCVGAPNVAAGGGINCHTYEKFLEATGLSQKSILTPSRMFSNHRSMLKPRDIKHRDKLRAAFTTLATLEEAPSPTPQNPSRYWTEPYL
ncbi:uncharacterized protein LOC108680112 [Hyalella azteca]|uniref:Uncharacterized protein LOC108680112 n=1 Tax=Hyalella azteca TaxID=294128 RepID=A0A8B7PFI8_HYAAZ|nr:uncharacterized protein LOC108680112 [Hyalella azteca]XP_047736151.1 uncharacterized protein LOC108680112 [Hyalella azteca]XP_047736152.1 uncharacterized protein LOC108680112 [Hyalella azteca]